MQDTSRFEQELDDLFDSIDKRNDNYFTTRDEHPAQEASVTRRPAVVAPVAPLPPRTRASGELKFAYRELEAGRRA